MKIPGPIHALCLSMLAAAGLLVSWQCPIRAEEIHYHIPHVNTAPAIDGVITEGEWAGAELVHLVNETHPSQNVPALVETEVLLLEDGSNFYLAFIAHDPQPDQIRAYYRDRDSAWDDDFVGTVIDTFNDERRAFEFFVNPLGVQMDLIQDDVARNEDASWNAIWDSAGKINDAGYVVEMKIPLNQLRFTQGLEQQTWSIDLLRFYPRDKRHRLSNNTSDYSISCYLCQLKKAQGFSHLEQHVNLQLVPTLTASFAVDRPSPAAAWRSEFNPEFGLDVRWGINQDFYLNATYNPDFSQVEADVARLDVNNTFTLYYPERREFFLDGADYFNTQVNLLDQNDDSQAILVNTRNISAPDYGIKLTGKRNANTYGLFFANDATTHFLIPGNQGSRVATLEGTESRNAVVRYRRDINRNINLGVIGTDRRADDYSNTVIGLDGSIRISDSDRVAAQWLKSYSDYPVYVRNNFQQAPSMNDSAYLLSYAHNDARWDWGAGYTEYGNDFRADMGFINRVDYRQVLMEGGHSWRYGPGSRFDRIRVGGSGSRSWDESGKNIGDGIELGVNANGPLQSFMYLGYSGGDRFFNGQYFDQNFIFFFGQMKPRSGMSVGGNISYGEGIDYANTRPGRILTIRPQFNMLLGQHLQLNLRYNYQRLNVDAGNLYYTNLADMRLTWQFNNRSFVRATIQYSDTLRNPSRYTFSIDKRSKNLTTQLLYSYKLNPQTRFFIGYSNTGYQNDTLDSITQTNHTIFTKFSYAWQY